MKNRSFQTAAKMIAHRHGEMARRYEQLSHEGQKPDSKRVARHTSRLIMLEIEIEKLDKEMRNAYLRTRGLLK